MRAKAVSSSRGAVVRFSVLFLVYVAVLYSGTTLDIVRNHVDVATPVTAATAHVTRFLVKLLHIPVGVSGHDVYAPTLHLRIADDCNGVIAYIIYMAAVLAFPSPWRLKGFGLVLGAVLISAVNIARILLLVYIAVYVPGFFYETHIYVAQSIVIAAGVVCWFFWAQSAVRASRSPGPSVPA